MHRSRGTCWDGGRSPSRRTPICCTAVTHFISLQFQWHRFRVTCWGGRFYICAGDQCAARGAALFQQSSCSFMATQVSRDVLGQRVSPFALDAPAAPPCFADAHIFMASHRCRRMCCMRRRPFRSCFPYFMATQVSRDVLGQCAVPCAPNTDMLHCSHAFYLIASSYWHRCRETCWGGGRSPLRRTPMCCTRRRRRPGPPAAPTASRAATCTGMQCLGGCRHSRVEYM